jgi:very-short-patch-repair endonuclease
MAERQIAETTQRGVVCFISNYSWLDGLSHTGMRERYLDAFDRIIIDNLHGDRIISEYAPDGRSSETVFAIRGNSAGIRIGTAIATLIRKPGDSTSTPRATLYYHDWDQARADERRQALLDSVGEEAPLTEYQIVKPAVEIGLPFKPRVVGANYFAWAKLPELFPVSFPGVKTSRDDALVAIDQSQLVDRMRTYLDPTVTEDVIAAKLPSLMKDSGRFNAREVRKALLSRNYTGIIVRYGYRPFDVRWLYWDADTKLLDEKRPEFVPHVKPENLFLFTTGRTRKNLIEAPIFTRLLNDLNLMDSGARGFPLYIYDATQMAQLELIPTEAKTSGRRPNLSEKAKAYLAGIYSSPPAPSPLYGEGKKLPYAQVYGGAALWEKIKPLARQMRHEPTKAEAVLWDVLRGRRFEGNKFRRQHPIDRFIVDFYCAEAHLVIEVDGEIHDYTPDEDVLRQQFIESRGLRVMRFRNVQVLDDLPGVLDTIQAALTPPLQAVERGVGGEDIPLEQQAETLFYHTLAVLHSPAYRVENAGALRQDWPRVPLPKTREALEASAALGRQVAALLDVETPVPGVTQGDPRPELRSIGVLMSANGGAPDFTINVNWGYFGAGSAVMPGRGRAVEADGLIDVYLNASTYWKGIPTAVWEYTLGGYQVLKKWLSYRETAVLGRPLKAEEAREFMHIARRIAALLALNDALDVNYRAVSGQ